MTWQAPHTPVADAAPRRPTALARLSAILTGAVSGPAENTSMPPESGTGQRITPDLTARAVRVCNRDPALIERYLRVHQILANKPSSEPENGQ